ncbi:hypothetical protein P4O66_001848 [Electrophorus voltai]|uniref:Ig-like domain-containing protein n=1 Tax=Electrophorus voltai TaxID=2609070 RepID=A0AAD8Z2W8_9TELE|nr:hypothetical protein P4O66_001848 [Electrophorus voltai]
MGMSIVLPCKVSLSLNDKLFEVRWYKNDAYDSPVLLYKDLEVQENVGASQYKNRVSLVGELEKGNISLKLDNLTLADRGEYVCLVKSFEWYDKASMTIIVSSQEPTPDETVPLAGLMSQSSAPLVSNEEIIRKWKKLKKSKVNLTLDPETLQKPLIVTRDRNGVYHGQLTKEGLGLTFPHVLGKEELSSGQQYWEVTVDKNAKCKRSWRVGVTQKPASEDVIRALCYEERYGIYASTDRHTLIPNEVDTEEIQSWVREVVQSTSPEHAWLGLCHTCTCWVSGESVCYWAPGNETGVEDCSYGQRTGALQTQGEQWWVSLPETQTLNFICSTYEGDEKEQNVTTQSCLSNITTRYFSWMETPYHLAGYQFEGFLCDNSCIIFRIRVGKPQHDEKSVKCDNGENQTPGHFQQDKHNFKRIGYWGYWYRPDNYNNPVLLYKDLTVKENAGDPQYRNRLSLVGELEKGDISLKLENLTLSDRGEYVCLVKTVEWYDKANMTLNITAWRAFIITLVFTLLAFTAITVYIMLKVYCLSKLTVIRKFPEEQRTENKAANKEDPVPDHLTLDSKTAAPILEKRTFTGPYGLRRNIKPSVRLRDLPTTAAASKPEMSCIGGQLSSDEPLVIHGHSVQEYQKIYHSAVDPMLRSPSGQAKPYSLELGRIIKQRLWEALFCPTLQKEVKPDGQVHVTETFSTPVFNTFAPFEMDTSGEPKPKKKRRRH